MKKSMVAGMMSLASLALVASQPMYPDPAAFAARVAAANAQHPMLRAAKNVETRLDVIDILIAFDQSAVNWLTQSGKGTPEKYAGQCVEKMNYCLEQSFLLDKFHFRLAGTVVIGENAKNLPLIGTVLKLVDVEGNVVATDEWKKITDARESLGADIVSVLVSKGATDNVGQGFSLDPIFGTSPSDIKAFGDWAYNACAIESVDDCYTQMHEIGHNLGCGHPDKDMAPGLAALSTPELKMTGPQLFEYSSGWYLWDGKTGYYTIMGYNWGGISANGTYSESSRFQPLPFFSTPNYGWKGHALGDALHDNRRTLLEVYKYAAQYRVSKVSDAPDNPLPTDPLIPDPEKPEGAVGVTPVKPSQVVNGMALARAAEVGGCLLDSHWQPTDAVSLKIGKAGKKGTKVSGSVTSFATGKKATLKALTVDLAQGPRTLSFEVKGLGTMQVKLGLDAAGQVAYSGALNGKTVTSASVGGSPIAQRGFSKPAVPAEVKGVAVNADYLPNNEPINMQGKKWVLNKAASIAYKKDKTTGENRWFVNNDKVDPKKTNLSGLKLTYKAKDGSFKGSFTIFGLQNGKLKKLKADVRGITVDGEGYGVVVVKGVDEVWPITVK